MGVAHVSINLVSPQEDTTSHCVAGFVDLCTTDILGWIIFGVCTCVCVWVGDCPVLCRMFSNISDLYPLDASSTSHPQRVYRKCPQTWANVPWG